MKKAVLWMVVLALGVASGALAQQPGEIFGRVTDASGAIMPGVAVTLTGGSLLQPMAATSSATGSYRFPGLGVGSYTVKFELTGFRTLIREGIRVEIGANVQINAALEISQLQETVTVTGETPVVDLRDTSKTSRFTQEALQSIPSARDPWVIIEQSAGVAMDRQNVGGSASGQQSNFVARGAAMTQQKWNLDGVDITDMSATGGSPVYFDFDAFEEMQISAGGADVTMQSPGVGVNLVTKSGTDRLKGSGRFYITDEKFQAINVDDTLRRQGAATGNPIQNIQDYGFEAGGPIVRGRAWFWGSYGKQNIDVGINNFFKNTPDCLAQKAKLKADPTSVPLEDVRGCLNSDSTLLNNYNAKVAVELFRNNNFSMLFNAAEKVRNARDASDLRPLETTYRQLGVTRKDLGSSWWKTGMPKTYKWSDRHIFSDRLMAEVSYAHVGNNFALTFHEDDLRTVQPRYEVTSVAGLWDRSYQEAVYVRPTDSVDVMANYFLPGVLGGDHAIKFGVKIRNDIAHTESMYGGDAYVRYNSGSAAPFTTPESAQIYRRGYTEYGLRNRNVYIQDSYTRKRLTVNLGVRFDYQNDFANPAQVAASEFYGKPTFAGAYNDGGLFGHRYDGVYTGATFNQLPGISFGGAESGVTFKDWSPRVGVTYDLLGNGRNVIKFNYARYVGQVGTGDMSSTYNTVTSTYVRYPWVDLDKNGFVSANEVVLLKAPLAYGGNYNYNNPTQTTTTGKVDPNLTSDKTDEILVSFDKQIGADLGISVAYIWRKYSNFRWTPTDNWGPADFVRKTFTPAASTCPSGATCPEVVYYDRLRQPGVEYTYTNQPDYWRGYSGFEVTARKRMSKGWMLNGSFSYNDAPVHYDSERSYQDPTNIEWQNGGQYAPESTSSGLGNVFINAKWLFRLTGAYQLPIWQINVAAFYNARSGYPYIRGITSPNRPFGAGSTTLYFEKRGDERLPTFQTVDFRMDKVLTLFNRFRVTASVDVFNLLNGHTTLSQRGTQNSSNANTISSLLAPRVARFGFRVTF